MEAFTTLMTLLQSGVVAYGMYNVVFGFIKLAEGIKSKTGPDIAEGAGQLIAGVLITLAAVVIGQIKIG